MTTLLKIKNEAETLPEPQQRELLLFLMERLRAKGPAIPQPRIFSREQIQNWINEDEEEIRRTSSQRLGSA
jgi:hypothetical protein